MLPSFGCWPLFLPLPSLSASPLAKTGFLSTLPQHFFQQGSFTLHQRLWCIAYKAVLYGVIGGVTGLAGTSLVHGLTALREQLDPEFQAPAQEQPLGKSAAVWGLYMAVGSNLRYQLVNGIERLLYSSLPTSAARTATVGMRLGNNFLGSAIFLWLAKAAHLSQPRQARQARVREASQAEC